MSDAQFAVIFVGLLLITVVLIGMMVICDRLKSIIELLESDKNESRRRENDNAE